MKYRKKPVVINSWPIIDLFGGPDSSLPVAVRDGLKNGKLAPHPDGISIQTIKGTMVGRLTDYLIEGVDGELYPCKGSIFEKTYEPESQYQVVFPGLAAKVE